MSAIPSTRDSFNPYGLDQPGGITRLENLRTYLSILRHRGAQAMLLGEAPGHRGCRWTGIPFTSEAILARGVDALQIFGPSQPFYRTSGRSRPMTEASATIVWSVLEDLRVLPVLWAAFPLHPHLPDRLDSNRRPRRAEVTLGERFWPWLVTVMQVDTVIAVGSVAHASARRLGVDAPRVRHPSHGGAMAFRRQLTELLESRD